MDLAAELERRHRNVRAAMEAHELDALIVSGSEYSGFEGAVTYMSGFQIVHRYAYVVLPATGDARSSSRRRRATSASTGRLRSSRSSIRGPGSTSPSRLARPAGSAVGVYGLDYIMAVRDYQALDGLELVPFDVEFDLARAVKSEAELESVRDSVRINQRGFEIWYEAYAPGKTAAEVMAAAEEWFVAEGCGRLTMNMVLTGTDTYARPEFKIARSDEVLRGLRAPVARGRRAGDALGRGLTGRLRRRRRAVRRHEADAGGVHGVLRGGADASSMRARAATTCTWPSREDSRSAATTSATSRATRSG